MHQETATRTETALTPEKSYKNLNALTRKPVHYRQGSVMLEIIQRGKDERASQVDIGRDNRNKDESLDQSSFLEVSLKKFDSNDEGFDSFS